MQGASTWQTPHRGSNTHKHLDPANGRRRAQGWVGGGGGGGGRGGGVVVIVVGHGET